MGYVMFNVKIKLSSVQLYFILGHNTHIYPQSHWCISSYSHWLVAALVSVFKQPLYYVVRR